jgi:hypothetical protein
LDQEVLQAQTIIQLFAKQMEELVVILCLVKLLHWVEVGGCRVGHKQEVQDFVVLHKCLLFQQQLEVQVVEMPEQVQEDLVVEGVVLEEMARMEQLVLEEAEELVSIQVYQDHLIHMELAVQEQEETQLQQVQMLQQIPAMVVEVE